MPERYFTDNGAVLCRDHLGASASITGRDIGGQPIERVTPDADAYARSQGHTFECETCRAIASHVTLAKTCLLCGNAADDDGGRCPQHPTLLDTEG